ncbi:MAG: hypothetical protein KatS3mg027_2382 [Bacteroidia bacterium]|nr:MAG: hypothetical protein KatS3mg027_2382 [Bacteroidia bacterium]
MRYYWLKIIEPSDTIRRKSIACGISMMGQRLVHEIYIAVISCLFITSIFLLEAFQHALLFLPYFNTKRFKYNRVAEVLIYYYLHLLFFRPKAIMNSNQKIQLSNRKYYIIGFILFVVALYIARLFYLQIIADEYKVYAQINAFEFLTEYPPRGYIYDRNGKLLVMNEPSYDLMVVPKEAKGCDTMALCEILEISKEEFIKRMIKLSLPPNSPRKQGLFEKQLSVKTYAALQEKMYRFNGFYVQVRSSTKISLSPLLHMP